MNEADILRLADKAARCVLKSDPVWTQEDWEDARQEAAVGVLKAIQGNGDTGEGYLFTAAKNEIYEWMKRWLRYRKNRTILDYLDYLVDDGTGVIKIDRERIASLAPMLERAKLKRDKHTQSKIQRDIHFLFLIMEGYSIDGIAMELGLTTTATEGVQKRLRKTLKGIAEGGQRMARRHEVTTTSRQALQRIATDPEILRRRADSWRATMAKKKQTEVQP